MSSKCLANYFIYGFHEISCSAERTSLNEGIVFGTLMPWVYSFFLLRPVVVCSYLANLSFNRRISDDTVFLESYSNYINSSYLIVAHIIRVKSSPLAGLTNQRRPSVQAVEVSLQILSQIAQGMLLLKIYCSLS